MWKASYLNKEISYSSGKLNLYGRKLKRVGKDRHYWGLSKIFHPACQRYMYQVCIKCWQESRLNFAFLQLYLLQKVSFSLNQVQNFTPHKLDIEPDGPILYRKARLIQMIRWVEDCTHVFKVIFKNPVILNDASNCHLRVTSPGSQQSRALVNEAVIRHFDTWADKVAVSGFAH